MKGPVHQLHIDALRDQLGIAALAFRDGFASGFGMAAKVNRRGKRVGQAQPAIDVLCQLVGRRQALTEAIDAHGQANNG